MDGLTPRYPLAYRDFRLFWIARIAAMLGLTCLVLAIGWQVYDLARQTMGIRGAAFRLGLVGLVQFVPVLLLTPLSGVLVDMFDRRHLARLAVALQLLGALFLLALAASGHLPIEALFIAALVLGMAKAFLLPAMNALAPSLIPREVLPRAVATSAVAGRVGAILGPIAGGAAYALAPEAAFGLSAVLLLIAVGCLSLIARPQVQAPRAAGHPLVLMREGLAYVKGNRLLLGTVTLDLFAVLLAGSTALLPVFARDILHVGPAGLGLLRAAPAAGALIVATWFSWQPPGARMARQMLVAVALFGAATIGFGLSRSLPLALGCLFVLGAADMVSVVVRQSLMQLHTPDAMRGRVGAISTLSISITNELGEAESGFLAALLGPVAAVVAGGAGAIAVAALWSRLFPELLRSEPPAPAPVRALKPGPE